MDEQECLICNCDISENYKPNIMIGQSCNCIYKVHDNCMIEWCKIKSKCLICHRPIKLYETNKHRPFKEEEEMPPRMSLFYKLFKCCRC